MKRNRLNSLLLTAALMLFVFTACSNKRKGDVLPTDKLEAVLYDYHLAQTIVHDLPSRERYKKDLYFDYVYDKHGVTQDEIDSTLVYYARYPEGLSEVYERLYQRIKADLERLESENKPLKVREAVAVAGDSADLWYDARLVQMSSSPLGGNRYTFTIPTDTNFHASDRLTWSGKALFLQGGVDSLHRYLHLNLKVRYMNDSIVSADTLLYTSGTFSIMVTDTAVVKSIDGTAYLKSSDARERLLLVEPQLLRYRSSNDSLVVDSVLIKKQVQEMNKKKLPKPSIQLEMQVAPE